MNARYLDPLDLIWLATAGRLGLVVRRSPEVYASFDGDGVLLIGDQSSLDPDDCLAQMILHELCHWIINGDGASRQFDWGFAPMEAVDWREWPTLRLQAWLCRRHGLESVLAPTTDARAYWDKLDDPLVALDGSDLELQVIALTQIGVRRARQAPWVEALDAALVASARLVQTCDDVSGRTPQVALSDALWSSLGS